MNWERFLFSVQRITGTLSEVAILCILAWRQVQGHKWTLPSKRAKDYVVISDGGSSRSCFSREELLGETSLCWIFLQRFHLSVT